MTMKESFVEAFKEFLRVFIIGEVFTIGSVIVIIQAGINMDLGTFGIDWNVALAVYTFETLTNIKTSLGKAVDKFIHSGGIETPLDLRSFDVLKGEPDIS